MNDDVLVRVENVSKRFCRSLKRSLWYGLQDLGSEIGGRRHGGGSGLPQSSADVQLRPDEFWAVKDVSFELRRGECLGLIGRNGAGKTTLLRMLNGLIKPDTGQITINGRVGALIALGSGFNPLLSGRENIYIGGSVIGLGKREIDSKIDEIISFAEIDDFIDSPVQSYSSGMQARLGFAIASSLNQEILLIDEILSVGDVTFREKCYKRLASLKDKGCSFVFVSHVTLAIQQMCDIGLYMEKGSAVHNGSTAECLSKYLLGDQGKAHQTSVNIFEHPRSRETGDAGIFIKSLKVDNTTPFAGKLIVRIEVAGSKDLPQGQSPLWLQVYLRRAHGQFMELTFEHELDDRMNYPEKSETILLTCENIFLPPSEYTLKASIVGKNPRKIFAVTDNLLFNVIDSPVKADSSSCDFIVRSFNFSHY